MRRRQLLAVSALLALVLGIAPGAANASDDPGTTGLLSRLTKNLAKPLTGTPSPAEDTTAPGAVSSSPKVGGLTRKSRDVSAAAVGNDAVADSYTVPQDSPTVTLSPRVQNNDGPAAVGEIGVNAPQHGTAGKDASGDVTYKPATGFTGEDTFEYAYFDGNVETAHRATITVTVYPTAPVKAFDDTYKIAQDAQPVTLMPAVTSNDVMPNPAVTHAFLLAHPDFGTVSADVKTYTPKPGFTGTDTFTYYIVDDLTGTSDGATVTITVFPRDSDDSVDATDDTYTVEQDAGPVTLTPPVTDNDHIPNPSTTTTFTSLAPEHGTVADDGKTYTPDSGFTGKDQFIYYNVDKSTGDSAGAVVTITVTPRTDPPGAPTAVDDAYTVAEDSGANLLIPAVSANDQGTHAGTYLETPPSHGTVDAALHTYSPEPGFSGTDTFTYSFVDGEARDSNIATVTITVTPTKTPTAPIAVDDAYTVAEDSGANLLIPAVSANDQGTHAGTYLETPPSHGTVDAALHTYSPESGFSGTDTFTYSFVDGEARDSNIATVTITVTPTGTPGQRVAGDDAYTVAQDSGTTTLTPAPLYNDQPELGLANKTFNVTTPAGHGTATITNAPDPDDTTFAYTPDPGFHGTDTFQYRYADADTGDNQSTIATVTITVTPTGGGGTGGESDLVQIETTCSGLVTFTNTSDLGLEVVYGSLPSEVDGDFVLAPGDIEEFNTERNNLDFRAEGPGDEVEEGTIRLGCSSGGGDDDDDDDHGKRHHGHLPDTGSPIAQNGLLMAWLLTAAGSYLAARSRRRTL